MLKLFSAIVFVFAALLNSGCKSDPYATESDVIINANRAAANNLILMAGPNINQSINIIAASFSNINNLTQSSSFGRVTSQQLVSQFTASGYSVVDMLLRNNVYVSQVQGEFLLSREVSAISAEHNAQLVLVGTYAVGSSNVFVTAKLIRAIDSVIIASHDYVLPNTRDMRTLLREWD